MPSAETAIEPFFSADQEMAALKALA